MATQGGGGGNGEVSGVETLKELFPDVPDKILQAFYAASGNDVEKTAEKLLSVMQAATEKQRRAEEASKEKGKSYVIPAKEYGGKCNYCNVSKTGRLSYGMQANQMTVQDYQDLIDRGWRRSGTWLYIPSNKSPECCCKQYTIRLDVDKYIANKSQIKTKKKLEKFISTGAPLPSDADKKSKKSKENKNSNNNKDKRSKDNTNKNEKPSTTASLKHAPTQQPKRQKQEKGPSKTSSPKEELVRVALEKTVAEIRTTYPAIPTNAKFPIIVQPNPPKLASRGNFSTNVATVMAGLATSEKGDSKGAQITPEQKAESLRKRNELAKEIAHRIQQALPKEIGASVFEDDSFINFTFPDEEATQSTSFTQSTSSQSSKSTQGHEHSTNKSSSASPSASEKSQETNPHKWKVVMVPSKFIQEEYDLYRKYQVSVHHDKPDKHTEEGYSNFLVESPLIPQQVAGLEQGYGSFHMQYRLNDKLIAVGVVDILPSCLSSVYFFYDPDFHALSLGVFSAINEIEWVKGVRGSVPNLHYYYMGFYIHTCSKMKYKGDYHPSDLLCLASYEWVPLDSIVPLLDSSKAFTPFVADKSKHQNISKEQALQIIEQVPMLIQGQTCTLSQLTNKGKQMMQPSLLQYLDRVGPELARRMMYIPQ